MRHRILGLIAAMVTSASVLASTAPAEALPVDYPRSKFGVYGDLSPSVYTGGYIYWYSRTAGIDGWVEHVANDGYMTQAVFDAFKGSTRIETQTRTVLEPNRILDFGAFAIGDPNLVGGIDRIRVTVCEYQVSTGFKYCSVPEHYWKKDAQ